MAYGHLQYSMSFVAGNVTTLTAPTAGGNPFGSHEYFSVNVTQGNAANVGFAFIDPGLVPLKIDMIGVKMQANQAGAVNFYVQVKGTPTMAPTTVMTFPVPTNAAEKVAYRRPTANIVVYPGQTLTLGVSTVVNGWQGKAYALVSPAWEEPENVTTMYKCTA